MMAQTKKKIVAGEQVNYSSCRVLGHAWDEVPSDLREKGKSSFAALGIHIDFRCVRCPVEKTEVWSKAGVLISRVYRYPKDFRLKSRLFKADFRFVYLSDRTTESRRLRFK